MNQTPLHIEEISDPTLVSQAIARAKRGESNDVWLQAHWDELLPHARGKFVVVAGQEAHVADSVEDAWRWAKAMHPEDDSATVRYVRTEPGPRIYAHSG